MHGVHTGIARRTGEEPLTGCLWPEAVICGKFETKKEPTLPP